LELRKKSETTKVLILEHDPITGAIGFRIKDGQATSKWAVTWDGTMTEHRFQPKAGPYTVQALAMSDQGVWTYGDQPAPPTPTDDPYAVTPPRPPTAYTIPAGAKIIEDGTVAGQTITADTYARHLGGTVIDGNVDFRSGSLHGFKINGNVLVQNNTTPGIIQDCEIDAKGQGIGIYAYRPDGLVVERCRISNCTLHAVRASTNNPTGEIIKSLTDLYLRGGNSGGSTDGKQEATLFIGHRVANPILRCDLDGGYTAALETANEATDLVFEHLKALNTTGPGTAVYLEHTTTNITFRHFWFEGMPNATRVLQTEYKANFPDGALHGGLWEYGTCKGGKLGFNFEDAISPHTRNLKFIGQSVNAIRYLNCTDVQETNNDYSQSKK
jgi:hypothetical protein